ncbi:nicotinate-nucleotide--dimethylbenzimidazole phosphoribosyltransferase [Ferroacidibacillus organovorans]|uniref:nicotinate-nucleotide--dimethylbenzimidazole phosphoribosyltransferase n=1 Tax=Ferroacidibacillus organovorans TaxID=1765683 RepID=UPI000A6917C3|nr:nicotinate-nucleotide--dimethylbenzimidazole phosphoribosyltransferase [Ferroacidibacillus organovorans]
MLDHRIEEALAQIERPDAQAENAARARLNQLTKPRGSLGMCETLLIQSAGIQKRALPDFDHPHIVVMAADHGIVEEGVSAYPSEVTVQMVQNFLAGGAAVNALARAAHAQVHVVDMGMATAVDHPLLLQRAVRRGSRNFLREEAMTESEATDALLAGIALGQSLAEPGGRVVALGEMGIGNTTTSAALLAALVGIDPEDVVGIGTGVTEAVRRHKVDVIRSALAFHRTAQRDAFRALQCLGGYEIAGLVGVAIGAAQRRAVILLDGLISTVAGVVAQRLEPRLARYFIAGHQSEEPGHRIALEQLGLTPVLQLGMRLGEASGATLALTVLQASARAMREMATFEEASVEHAHDEPIERGQMKKETVGSHPVRVLPVAKDRGAACAEAALSQEVACAVPHALNEPGFSYAKEALEFSEHERAAVYKAIFLRRDIRQFARDPLPEDVLRRILDAGHHGPSVGFMQPWNFLVIRGQETKERLWRVVDRERMAAALHFEGDRRDEYLRLKVEGIREAPITVCITSDPTRGGAHVLGRNSIRDTDRFSVSCAIENIWLAARAENVAVGWVSIYQHADVQQILSIPPHVEPVGLLTVGYPLEWPQEPLLQRSGWRQRIPLEDLLFEETWGRQGAKPSAD